MANFEKCFTGGFSSYRPTLAGEYHRKFCAMMALKDEMLPRSGRSNKLSVFTGMNQCVLGWEAC